MGLNNDGKNDGGPAFPLDMDFGHYHAKSEGMSLRDWFAGQELAALTSEYCQTVGHLPETKAEYERLARRAYAIADAMLDVREGV